MMKREERDKLRTLEYHTIAFVEAVPLLFDTCDELEATAESRLKALHFCEDVLKAHGQIRRQPKPNRGIEAELVAITAERDELNEGLNAAREQIGATSEDLCVDIMHLQEERDDMTAERDRMRDAIEEIRNQACVCDGENAVLKMRWLIDRCQQALKESFK